MINNYFNYLNEIILLILKDHRYDALRKILICILIYDLILQN